MVVYQDKKNSYWFGSWEEGLYSYNGKTILHYTTKHGLPSNRVEEIKEDKSGNLYLSTSSGVCRFDGKQFTSLLVANSTESEWKLNPDDLWFKNWQSEGLIFRYDGEKLHSLKLPPVPVGEELRAKYPDRPNPYAVYTIYNDSKGNVWFGTATLGACRFNGENFQWIAEEDVTELHDGPSNGVRSIIEDKNGYFWFNSAYKYNVYNQKSSSKGFYTKEKSVGNLDKKRNDNLNEYLSISKDKKHNLWIATYNDGVYCINGKKIIRYPVQNNGKDIHTFYIYSDNSGNIWLGTHENGVYKFNGKKFEVWKTSK